MAHEWDELDDAIEQHVNEYWLEQGCLGYPDSNHGFPGATAHDFDQLDQMED